MAKYYFIGIKGAGMSSLACILHDLGHDVEGSDKETYFFVQKGMDERGIKLYPFGEHNPPADRILVRSTAYTEKNNGEIKYINKKGYKVIEYHEMLGELTKWFKTIAICGCHGKTTTTALLSHVMENYNVNYLIGDGQGYANKENKTLIIEACEYKRHFLEYQPHHLIVTNIELDHIDYFKDIDDVRSAYEELINKATGQVVACGDDPEVRKMKLNKKILYYGINPDNDIVAKNVIYSNDGIKFDCYIENKFFGNFTTTLFGAHMLLNALGVIAISYFEGLKKEEIEAQINTYKGARRRFVEKVIGDSVLIDDYAHHPTEIAVTIKAAKQKYANKKIIAIFESHTFSRVKKFYREFADALNLADYTFVAPIAYDRENPHNFPGISDKLIINLLDNGEEITYDEVEKLLPYKNEVFLFMSSKNIYMLKEELELKLEEK